ncbi:MAG TPA: S8 family serine peptidase [Streptosporangiaceae bacterium]
MLTRRGVLAVIVITAAAALTAGPARAASARPGTPGAPAAPAVAPPSGAGTQLGKDVEKAWEITKGGGVCVAVLSTGVDPAVPGLVGKVTTGPDYVGYRHPQRTSGTLLAGLIAGSGPTAAAPLASSGIAPEARILSIRLEPDKSEPKANQFFNDADYISNFARAIRYAVDHGAQVIDVASASSYSATSALESAVAYAATRNVVIVATEPAFGSPMDAYSAPASVPGVIGAGSVDLSGANPQPDHSRSARNDSVLVSGPGNPVVEDGPADNVWEIYGPWVGAGWVAATAALIKSVYPHLPPVLVARAMELSARDRPAGGYSTTSGFGLINPGGALAEAGQLAQPSAAAAAQPGGPAAQSQAASFRAGSPLPAIDAVRHSPARLAGFSAAVIAGIALMAGAFLLRRRWAAPGSVPEPESGRQPGASPDPEPEPVLQKLAEPQDVTDAGLHLDPSGQPGPRERVDVVGQFEDHGAGRGHPDVGRRVAGGCFADRFRCAVRPEPGNERDVQVGYAAGERAPGEEGVAIFRVELREPPGQLLECLAAFLGRGHRGFTPQDRRDGSVQGGG